MKSTNQHWNQTRIEWLDAIPKGQLITAILAVWDLMDNHHCITGKGITIEGEKLPKDDYAVMFPNEVSREVIEKLLPKWWERD